MYEMATKNLAELFQADQEAAAARQELVLKAAIWRADSFERVASQQDIRARQEAAAHSKEARLTTDRATKASRPLVRMSVPVDHHEDPRRLRHE